MADLLKQSALAYKELLPFRYHFFLGRKRKLRYVSLQFPEVAYHHLAGFHRAGIAALSNKKKALQVILAEDVRHDHFVNAGKTLEDRWIGICHLREIIESNRMVFYYRGHEQPGTVIKGDYLMLHEGIVFFIARETPESIFIPHCRRYELGCPRFTTLQICREEKVTEEVTCLYRSPSFQAPEER